MLTLLVGIAIGCVLTLACVYAWRRISAPLHTPSPARRERFDTRPGRDAGEHVFRDHPPRLERLSEPPSFDPFHEEHTR